MRRFHTGLAWLAIAALASLAVLALLPATAGAGATEPPPAGCALKAGFVAVPGPPPIKTPYMKAQFGLVTNLDDKIVDIAVIKDDPNDGYIVNAKNLLEKTKSVALIKDISSVADAVTEITTVYNSNTPARPLNVFIVGHGFSGQVQVGDDVIGDESAAQRTKQATLIAGLKGKIEHLKLIACSTGFAQRGQDFLEKLRIGLQADRVSGFTNLIRPWPNDYTFFPQFQGTLRVDQPGAKKNVVGGVPVAGDLAGLPLEAPDSSGPGPGVLAAVAGAAAGAVALGGAALYARRRWLR